MRLSYLSSGSAYTLRPNVDHDNTGRQPDRREPDHEVIGAPLLPDPPSTALRLVAPPLPRAPGGVRVARGRLPPSAPRRRPRAARMQPTPAGGPRRVCSQARCRGGRVAFWIDTETDVPAEASRGPEPTPR